MASVTERLAGGQTGSIDPTGARTVTRIFDVHHTSSLSLQSAIALMDSAAGIEIGDTIELGTVWDYDTNAYVPAVATYYGQKSWKHAEGDEDHWVFTLVYSTAPSAAGGDDDGSSLALVTTQGTTSATVKSVYRIDTITTNIDAPDEEDIGGRPVDIGGTPTSILSLDRRFVVTEKLHYFPEVGYYSALTGCRNNAVYEGGAIGTILYVGFSWSQDSTSGMWNVTHNFAVDNKTFHCEQVAKTDPQGDIIISDVNDNKNAIGSPYVSYHAGFVYWRQPFALTDLSALPTTVEE